MSERGKSDLELRSYERVGRNLITIHEGSVKMRKPEDAELAEVAAEARRGWGQPLRPRLLPALRDTVAEQWRPDGPFTKATRAMHALREHAHDFKPSWERAVVSHAQLWFVGAPMCDLLAGAAGGIPPLRLTSSVLPDDEGFVWFESPLAGVDADGSDHAVTVGAYLWGRAEWENPRTKKHRPVIGITVYGPGLGVVDVPLMPLGGLVWPFGETCDVEWFGGDQRDQSMIEDRRRLLALWVLSTQPGLTSSVLHEATSHSKAKAKRIAAGKVQADPPVRVVQLRRQPKADVDAPERRSGDRTYRHRWTVSGHWRQQAFGPAHSLRKPLYINPYLKGPDDAPLLKSERVKSWVK